MKTHEGLVKLRITCPAGKCRQTADTVGPGCVACAKAGIFALDAGSHVVAELVKKPAAKEKKAAAKKK